MLEIKNVYKTYKTKNGVFTRALDGVSINFPEKGMVFILGKSGSGKSTLLNICGGLDKAESGEIIIKGRSSANFSNTDFDSYRNTCVGFVFQEYNILNEFTVEENIAIALELQNKRRDFARVAQILESVEMQNFATRKPATLSGGQKQRVAIARALVKNPEIILADEPSGALDSDTGKQVFDTLKKLSADKLVIVVSHDREFAEKYADRIIELKDGRVISDMVRADAEGENVTFIGTDTVCINERSKLTQSDIEKIHTFLSASTGGAVITTARETVDKTVKNAPRMTGGFGEIERQPESRPYTAEEQKLIRSRLPVRHAMRIGASSLKVKPVRLVFTIFLTTVAFIMFGMFSTMMLYNEKELVIDAVKGAQFVYVSVGKCYRVIEEYPDEKREVYETTMLTREEYAKIKAAYPGSFALVSQYDNYDMDEVTDNEYGLYDGAFDGFVLSDDGMQLLAGSLPQSSEEIAVTDFVFENLKADYKLSADAKYFDAVGYTLSVCGVPFTISGVFKGETVPTEFEFLKNVNDGNAFSLSSEELVKQNVWFSSKRYGMFAKAAVSQKFIDKYKGYIFNTQPFDAYDYFDLSVTSVVLKYSVGNNNNYSSYNMLSRYDGGLPLYNLKGERINSLNSNAVAVAAWDLGIGLRVMFGELYGTEVEPICNKLMSSNLHDVLEGINEMNAFLSDNNLPLPQLQAGERDAELGGFFFAPENQGGGWCCYLGDELYSIYFNAENSYPHRNTEYVPDSHADICAVFIPRENGDIFARRLINGLYDLQDDDSRGMVNASYMGPIQLASEVVFQIRYVLLGVGLVLGAFSILLLFNFISASITAKKKEIGILRALGARTTDVFGIFFFEGLMISMTSFVISCLGTLALCAGINNILRNELLSVNFFIFGPLSVLCVLAMTFITAFISTALPVALYSKKPPVDSIRAL